MSRFTIGQDRFVIEKLLPSLTRERITLNGNVVFEGDLIHQRPVSFASSGRQFEVAKEDLTSLMAGYSIRVSQNGRVEYDGLYNDEGEPIQKATQLKSLGWLRLWSWSAAGIMFLAVGIVLRIVFPNFGRNYYLVDISATLAAIAGYWLTQLIGRRIAAS